MTTSSLWCANVGVKFDMLARFILLEDVRISYSNRLPLHAWPSIAGSERWCIRARQRSKHRHRVSISVLSLVQVRLPQTAGIWVRIFLAVCPNLHLSAPVHFRTRSGCSQSHAKSWALVCCQFIFDWHSVTSKIISVILKGKPEGYRSKCCLSHQILHSCMAVRFPFTTGLGESAS